MCLLPTLPSLQQQAEHRDALQAPRSRLSHLLSVQARNLPAHPSGPEASAAYFVLWAHHQPGASQQSLSCVYVSEQVACASATPALLLHACALHPARSQVCGTPNPAWKALDLSQRCSRGYGSGLLHVHVYLTACSQPQPTGLLCRAQPGAHSEQHEHPIPQADLAEVAAAESAASQESRPSFKASVWRSLTRADSSAPVQQQAPVADDAADGPVSGADCCEAIPLEGQLVATASLDLGSLPLLAKSWASLATLDPVYAQPTLLLELSNGIHSVPALSEAEGAETAAQEQATPANSSTDTAGEVCLLLQPLWMDHTAVTAAVVELGT